LLHSGIKPGKFIPYVERRIGRSLTADKKALVDAAREVGDAGGGDAVTAMRAALVSAHVISN